MSQVIVPITLDYLPSRGLFEATPPETLFHYTNFDGAAGIMTSRSLWLSKFNTTNDTSELTLAVQMFTSLVERAVPTLPADEAGFLRAAVQQLDSFRRTNICVTSFCENPDLLSQWRSYGNDGKGLALGFDATVLVALAKQHDLRLVRCTYDQIAHVRLAEELISMLVQSFRVARPSTPEQVRDLLGCFNGTFLAVAPAIKAHHFAEEGEWRLVSKSRSVLDPQMIAVLRGNIAGVKFVVPFAAQGRALIPKVVIGPMPDARNVADALDVFAERNGFHFSSIMFSQVPYRQRS